MYSLYRSWSDAAVYAALPRWRKSTSFAEDPSAILVIRVYTVYPIIAIRFHTWGTHTEYQQVMTLLCHQSYSKPKDVAWTGRMEILTKSCACTLGASEIPFTWGKAQNYHTQEQSSDTLDMGSTPKRDQFNVSVPTSFWSAVNERKKTHAIARSWSSRIRKMPSTCRYFP